MQPFGENASNIPAFLGKLWKMVNDPNTDHIICWSPAGNSFIIHNQAQFWYELLPLYYKHNNMSSFVRQLNMYGFHKMSTVENGTMDADKDEIQFYHSYFQKGQPELLKNIKRKVTTTKTENTMQNIVKSDDMARVLNDVKQLRGRQSTVDSQLTAMKQENAVLWRELALLRQKHLKQQQIVNKLIQFLVTLVQPTANSRMGVGVKRRMPLMLHENPVKKSKVKKTHNENFDNGPTIHELDTEITPDELYDQNIDDHAVVSSPLASVTSPQTTESTKTPSISSNDGNADNPENLLNDNFWDKPEFIEVSQVSRNCLINDNDLEENINALQNNNDHLNNKEIFLNPITRDTLLSNLANGSYNSNIVSTKNGKKVKNSGPTTQNLNNSSDTNNQNNSDTTVATRDCKMNNAALTSSTNGSSRNDLDLHLESTQNEIEQLKEILQGCNTFDAHTLLGLFNDEVPNYGLTPATVDKGTAIADTVGGDPMVSGTELANCTTNVIDFNELFDDSLDGHEAFNDVSKENSSTVNTPMIIKTEPFFPNVNPDL